LAVVLQPQRPPVRQTLPALARLQSAQEPPAPQAVAAVPGAQRPSAAQHAVAPQEAEVHAALQR
jgi:hypothetical protein